MMTVAGLRMASLVVPRQNAIRWQKMGWVTGSAVLLAVAFA
jgi:hypothetical protein